MDIILHNWWQLLVAAVPYFMLGAIWYNPKVLGSAWASGHGLDMSEAKKKEVNMGKLFGLSFLCTIILSALVCLVCCHAAGSASPVACGAMVGTGAFAAMSMNYIYLMKPTRVFLIDGGYHLIGCMMVALVLKALGCC